MRIAIVAVLCCVMMAGCPKQPSPERPRPARDSAASAKKAAEKRYAAVVQTLQAAIKKGGMPNIETVLQRHFQKIDPVCHGKLVTKLGTVAIPLRHKKLPKARLEPGLMLFLEPNDEGGTPLTAPKSTGSTEKESGNYSVCFLSITPPEDKKSWQVTLQRAGNIIGPFETMETSWQEFPPGNAILTLEANVVHQESKGDDAVESRIRVLFSYVDGRLFELHTGFAKMGSSSKDFRSQELRTIKFLTVGSPVRRLMVEILRSESAGREPAPDGTQDWAEGTWEETYAIYEFDKRLVELKELKGEALGTILEYTKLAPYRIKKSGKGTSFDDDA